MESVCLKCSVGAAGRLLVGPAARDSLHCVHPAPVAAGAGCSNANQVRLAASTTSAPDVMCRARPIPRVCPRAHVDHHWPVMVGCVHSLVLDDIWFYWFHRGLHSSPWLYKNFHKVLHTHHPQPLHHRRPCASTSSAAAAVGPHTALL